MFNQHLRNARIDPICRRIHPRQPEQHCTAGTPPQSSGILAAKDWDHYLSTYRS
jgi:hypothetical protein